MVDDTTKIGILDWLFGKKALEKASQTGNNAPTSSPSTKPIAPQTIPQDTSYLKKKIDEQMAAEKAKKDALDKLKQVK